MHHSDVPLSHSNYVTEEAHVGMYFRPKIAMTIFEVKGKLAYIHAYMYAIRYSKIVI